MPKKPVALLLACHPGPTLVVTVVAIVLSVAIALPGGRLTLLAAAVFTGQLSIGWSNDWLDAGRDTQVHRADKPIASGALRAAAVRAAAFVALTACIVLSLSLGPLAAAAVLVGVAAGWAYNLGLKTTAASVVPYFVCFGLLPAAATFAQSPPAAPAWWAVVVGALLGVAAHFTNVLPDLDDDARTGVRGLPHIIGGTASGIAAFCVVAVAGVLLVIGPGLPPAVATVTGFIAIIAISAVGVILTVGRSPSRALMRLVMTAAIIAVVLLAFTGQALSS